MLRLVDSALDAGRIAGQVEAVETGQSAPVTGADDLLAFLLGAGASFGAGSDGGSKRWDIFRGEGGLREDRAERPEVEEAGGGYR